MNIESNINKKLESLYSLKGLNIIVTGGSSGLGLNMSIVLAELGANVWALSRSGKVKVETELEIPQNITFDKMDVSKPDSIKNKIHEIGQKNGIDVLVNNAGITIKKKAESYSAEEFRQVHDVNVDGLFMCCKHAFPYLKKSKHIGRIINISSMASFLGFSEVVSYSSSKSAVLGVTRGLCVEWAKENILVNSVSPGWFPSLMNQQVMDEDRQKKILSRMPLNRYGKPEELSAMIAFLASPSSTYISGQDFSVDGGALSFGY